MTIWIDAQLSPALATWFQTTLAITAVSVRDVGLRDATDEAIFQAARDALVVVLTKDSDFVHLLERHGPPPQVVWLTCGNTSNAALTQILEGSWSPVAAMLGAGEALIEISDLAK